MSDELVFEVPRCRVCGCTDEHACEGGCSWVDWDLCSRCAAPSTAAVALVVAAAMAAILGVFVLVLLWRVGII